MSGSRPLQRRQQWLYAACAAPAMLALLALLVWPLLQLLALSVEGQGLGRYEEVVTDPLYLEVFWRTFRLSFLVALISALLGYPVAHLIATASRPVALLALICVLLPFWTSLLVRTYAWMVLLGNNGVINRLLLAMGAVERPVRLANNEIGVVIAMVHVLLPYFILPACAVMRRMDRGLLLAAEGLGASGWQVFRQVYFPLTRPGVVAGFALVFILSLGFFITPALLGGGRVMLISLLIQQQVLQVLDWGFGATLCLVLMAVTLLSYTLISRFGKDPRDAAA